MTKPRKAAGCWWIHGRPYPSVTTCMGVLARPGLEWWKRQQVYLAMAANPSLTESEALAAPYRIGKQAARRGSEVHTIVGGWPHMDLRTVPAEWRGYARAFRVWATEYNPEIIAVERVVWSDFHGYAGRLDIELACQDSEVARRILDIKTGESLYEDVWYQVAAYAEAYHERTGREARCSALLLREDGTYDYQHMPHRQDDYLSVFLACKTIWLWENRKKMEKLRAEANLARQKEKP